MRQLVLILTSFVSHFALFLLSPLHAEEKTSSHQILLESGPLSYLATVGSVPLKDNLGKSNGEIGFIAYTKEDPASNRPITFAFNGGPGSSSVWLHMGAFGPRRALTPEEGQTITPPYAIKDNLDTILDLTDLVFIDPVGTGLTQIESEEVAKSYCDIAGDVRLFGNFIRDYLTTHKRWSSPKYLAGESYGTLRAAGLANYLQDEYGIYLNGLILVSCAIDYQTIFFDPDNLLPYLLFLPTYATTAWHYGRLDGHLSLQEIAEKAREFAYSTYAPTLLQRNSLTADQKHSFYQKLAAFTGLSFETVRRSHGRLSDDVFLQEFLADQDKILGRYDSRDSGDFSRQISGQFSIDPSISAINGIFSSVIHDYLQSELECPASYCLFSVKSYLNWNYLSYSTWGYPNLMKSLRQAMLANPSLKIFVGCGYFDCATPFAATEYCFDHLDLSQALQGNIQMNYYEGGHMYYTNPSARTKFKQDLIHFYPK